MSADISAARGSSAAETAEALSAADGLDLSIDGWYVTLWSSGKYVSTHIRSSYAKLGVRDRSSAVQRTRELRLLAADRAR
jgi:hypothetical protein